MFPSISVHIRGLDPSALYSVALEIVPHDGARYKFFNNKWMEVGKADYLHPNDPYIHPDSPNLGQFWMLREVSFGKVKLTNNWEKADDAVSHMLLILQGYPTNTCNVQQYFSSVRTNVLTRDECILVETIHNLFCICSPAD